MPDNVCAGCGASMPEPKYGGRGGPRKWCSEACRQRSLRSGAGIWKRGSGEPRSCAWCSSPFEPYKEDQRVCSRRCGWLYRSQPKLTGRPTGKGIEHDKTCEVCGVEYRGIKRSLFCSDVCRWKRVRGYRPCDHCGQRFGARQSVKYCSDECKTAHITSKAQPKEPKPGPHKRIWYIDCQDCERCFIARGPSAKRCPPCRAKDHSARIMGLYRMSAERGRVREAMHWRLELVDYLRNRDGDDCGICNKRVTFGVTTGPHGVSDYGPSIDHVIPRSKGGSDDLTNLRLTHWTCNRRRGNRGTVEQLRLVG